ncbi:hypothetical protein PCANC_23820 [Puccinia coronata f. sp. avenae]|uniref:Uncharacterized protein n=1 Tax=Puccinia coronata f. sp. avenae TaxID=200324 RepID=A0A2N5SBB6_9BASI|nr:hypothetical protein PCANC_23820 [Puccinia coronata f. sp. avenae]
MFDLARHQEALHSIKGVVENSHKGKLSWEDFILEEASSIVCKQKPKSGCYPNGAYYSSKELNQVFFTEEARTGRAEAITESMSCLYTLIMRKLAFSTNDGDLGEEEEDNNAAADLPPLEVPIPAPHELHVHNIDPLATPDPNARIPISLSEDNVMEIENNISHPSTDPKMRKQKQNKDMARTICSMVAYGQNRRHNGLQLTNGSLFIACGVTERVNKYLNYVGLSCSRKTAHLGLASLGKESQKTIKTRFSNALNSKVFPPSICIDNLDFQQSIHTKSVSRMSTMFHGTGGYIHCLPQQFLDTLDHAQLSLSALKRSLKKSINLVVQPHHFGPTFTSEEHFESTLKAQLTSAFLRYIGSPREKEHSLKAKPPPVRPVKPDKPNLTMLKLMMASDNPQKALAMSLTV